MDGPNWSILGDLPNTYRQAQSQRTLADLGKGLASGNIDYRQAAGKAAEAGRLDLALSLIKLGGEEEASKQFQQMFGPQAAAVPQAQPAAVPQPTQAQPPKPVTLANLGQAAPMSDAGVPAAPPRAPVQSSPRVWGDDEAVNAGLYPPQRQAQAVPAAPAAPTPPQPPAATPDSLNLTPQLRQLIAAAAHPRLPAAQKEIAKTLLTRELDNSKLPDPVKKYLFAKGQGFTGSFLEFETQLRRSGATVVNVDQKGESEFEKIFGAKQAARWNKYIDDGQAAQRKLVDIQNMREISARVGSVGATASFKETVGPLAEALGISVDGLSDIQAYSSIIERLAPQQRAPGSGSTSDVEYKGFKTSLPGLIQNPAAREITLNTMEALTRDEIARGEIASKLATKEITRQQAELALRNLPDPMKAFADWRKANPQLYAQARTAKPAAAQTGPTREDIERELRRRGAL